VTSPNHCGNPDSWCITTPFDASVSITAENPRAAPSKGSIMNISTRTRIACSITSIGMLAGLAACGTDTVSDTDPGNQPAAKPAIASPGHYAKSADSAEREAAAEKARQDRASTARWARGTRFEIKLRRNGHPTQP
jgi:hypothetical protein